MSFTYHNLPGIPKEGKEAPKGVEITTPALQWPEESPRVSLGWVKFLCRLEMGLVVPSWELCSSNPGIPSQSLPKLGLGREETWAWNARVAAQHIG